LIFWHEYGFNNSKRNYPDTDHLPYINVQVIIRLPNNRILVGITGQKTLEDNGKFVFVGGTVREYGEFTLKNCSDLIDYCRHELKEETSIKSDKKLKLFGSILSKETFSVVCEVNIREPVTKVLKVGEFSDEKILKISDIRKIDKEVQHSRFIDAIELISNKI
jgi:hypothetical protein